VTLLRKPGHAPPPGRVSRAATDQADLRTQALISNLFQPRAS
jgi:hypothetical protein